MKRMQRRTYPASFVVLVSPEQREKEMSELVVVNAVLPECVIALDHVLAMITDMLVPKTLDGAAAIGSLRLLRAFRHLERTPAAMDRAAAHGHIDVLKWLNAHSSKGCTKQALIMATKRLDQRMVEYLIRAKLDDVNGLEHSFYWAAKHGHSTLVEALGQSQYLSRYMVYEAIEMAVYEQHRTLDLVDIAHTLIKRTGTFITKLPGKLLRHAISKNNYPLLSLFAGHTCDESIADALLYALSLDQSEFSRFVHLLASRCDKSRLCNIIVSWKLDQNVERVLLSRCSGFHLGMLLINAVANKLFDDVERYSSYQVSIDLRMVALNLSVFENCPRSISGLLVKNLKGVKLDDALLEAVALGLDDAAKFIVDDCSDNGRIRAKFYKKRFS